MIIILSLETVMDLLGNISIKRDRQTETDRESIYIMWEKTVCLVTGPDEMRRRGNKVCRHEDLGFIKSTVIQSHKREKSNMSKSLISADGSSGASPPWKVCFRRRSRVPV